MEREIHRYRILIDGRTLKKNPEAGKTKSYYAGPCTMTLDIKGKVPVFLHPGENCEVTETTMQAGKTETKMIVTDPKTMALVMRKMRSWERGWRAGKESARRCRTPEMSVEVTRPVQTIPHFPLPYYFYKYKSVEVMCAGCGKSFDHRKLQTGECRVGEEEAYSSRICPFCHTWDCCDLEYETPKEAMERIGKGKDKVETAGTKGPKKERR
jgi:hypothetical protein